MRRKYPSCFEPIISEIIPYSGGKTAPPTIPIINNAAPIFVNLPRPLIAKGQIAGHITAFEKPSNAKQKTAIIPVVKMASNTSTIDKTTLQTNAFCCDI